MTEARPVSGLNGYLRAVGLIGPGLDGWSEGAAMVAGAAPYVHARTRYPPPAGLPPAERRRTGDIVKLALAAGFDACEQAGQDPRDLASVFASSGGDGKNCHAICEGLAAADPGISPTRFHNSVNNAPNGYWCIATRDMAPATTLCAYDGSFAAGLLEALAQVTQERRSVLLVAYDADYPEPLHSVRPIPDGFGVALLLAPEPDPGVMAGLQVALTDEAETTLDEPALERLRRAIPAARSLPLLRSLARRESGRLVLEYLDGLRVSVETAPWGTGET